MSLGISFYSFSGAQWNPRAPFPVGPKQELINALTWEFEGEPVLQKKIETVELIAKQGIDYSGLGPEYAEDLDELVNSLPGMDLEGIEFKPRSPDTLHRDIVFHIFERLISPKKQGFISKFFSSTVQAIAEPKILPYLIVGRRTDGSATSQESLYVIYSPEELTILKAEIECALSLDLPWPDADSLSLVKEFFLEPIDEVIKTGHHLFARLS